VLAERVPVLEQLLRREKQACEAFVDLHYRGVHRFFFWLTGSRDAAADLTQETFACFWESLGRREGGAGLDPKAWLYGIARNRWRKRLRGQKSWAALEEAVEVPDAALGPEEVVLRTLETEEVLGALTALAPELREALVLRVFQELSYAEIGEALLISEGLARWRVHRARTKLAGILGRAKEAIR
jgi:RNA polymerase sigma-70 factor, ECF subfamily